jgi:hypothetical protein
MSIEAIKTYLNGGGHVIFNTDAGDLAGLQAQGGFNAIMPQLGGTISSLNAFQGLGPHTTTDITVNAFTKGVASVNYDYTSTFSGGTELVKGSAGLSFVNYEQIGQGFLFAVADLDVASAANFTGDNPRLYCNVGGLSCGAPTAGGAVPEPASWALMLIGFGGLGATLRRRRRHWFLAAA